MTNNKPTRPPSSKAKRAPKPQPVAKAPHLEPEELVEDLRDLPVRSKLYLKDQLPPDRYQKKAKVGTPTLGRETGYVTEVGLGNLTSLTAYDNTDIPT